MRATNASNSNIARGIQLHYRYKITAEGKDEEIGVEDSNPLI